MNYSNESVCTIVVVHNPEMPTSGNLKSGDSFFCITPSPPAPTEYQWSTPPPPLRHNSIQFLISLGHYIKSYMRYRTITISFYDCNVEIIFVSDKIRVNMPQKPNFESKDIRILGENGINSKLKRRKAHNSILSERFGDLYSYTMFSVLCTRLLVVVIFSSRGEF